MLLLALSAAVSPVPPQTLISEAQHAIRAGRVEQARLMVARAVANGAQGPHVERTLADLAFESGNYAEAATRYEILASSVGSDTAVIERAGIAALKSGEIDRATIWISKAVERDNASWRAWNAHAVLADLRGDYEAADLGYAKAREISPANVFIASNQGWSLLMRGAWQEAVMFLEQAAAAPSVPIRVRNNLELAQAALEEDLPARRAGEDDESWAARLNDLGVLAYSSGQRPRAIAAFTQALEARSVWFERAANNLRAAEKPQ